jgi:hypothetical protein
MDQKLLLLCVPQVLLLLLLSRLLLFGRPKGTMGSGAPISMLGGLG